MSTASASASASRQELKKTKNINGEDSVASSLNSVVKKQFTNMAEQYNLYASTINSMEEKIKELKNIMLSECFLKHCQHFSMDIPTNSETKPNPKPKTNHNPTPRTTEKHIHESNNNVCDQNIIISSNETNGNTVNEDAPVE